MKIRMTVKRGNGNINGEMLSKQRGRSASIVEILVALIMQYWEIGWIFESKKIIIVKYISIKSKSIIKKMLWQEGTGEWREI